MPEQRRQHLRLPIESTTCIKMLSSRVGQSESGKKVICKTLNVSRGGLQVILAEELAVGAILNIDVTLPGTDSILSLAGEVRWCLPSKVDNCPWMAGFQLLNADNSDFDQWAVLIASMES